MSGCGFQPLYGTRSQNSISTVSALQNTDIALIPNFEGQYLRNALIDQFYPNGYPQNAQYTLEIAPIQENRKDLDLTRVSDATRSELELSSRMLLRDKETGAVLMTRNINTTTSYNLLASEFSTRVSKTAARENLLDDMARQVERYLALYFQGN